MAEPVNYGHVTTEMFSLRQRRVYVAGHRGMVGSACVRRLAAEGAEVITASRAQVDLTRQAEVETFMQSAKPDIVVVAAARVGGIMANNTMPANFLYENLMIEANLIHAAHSRQSLERTWDTGAVRNRIHRKPIPGGSSARSETSPILGALCRAA